MKVHSFLSLGCADGPGVRSVLFLQGCCLKCAYCHNPDTWFLPGFTEISSREIAERVAKYRPYYGKTGGLTVSGGEPLIQAEELTELFSLLSEMKIHRAIDTSGFCPSLSSGVLSRLLSVTGLIICDIKFSDDAGYQRYCNAPQGAFERIMSFLSSVQDAGCDIWIRHVVLPGITDNIEYISSVFERALAFKSLKRFELLPFRTLCRQKYESLRIEFPMKDTPDCTQEKIQQLYGQIKAGFPAGRDKIP